ncbi:hypothetical protein BJV82DRAFT_668733 [Fennellomyces sp. T-0311]|nr:hypothetical protein BJV82DRAFT_668733 [Fennellomyces sp. T-0311]
MTIEDRLLSLPSEIQDRILNHLTFHGRLQCSAVCSSWRLQIINRPSTWKRLSIKDGLNIVPYLLPYRKYIQGSDVKHLSVSSAQSRVSEAVDFVVKCECEHIEEVEFSVERIYAASSLKLARVCGHSLTRIIVTVRSGYVLCMHDLITPEQILLHCPSLKKLHFHCRQVTEATRLPSLADFRHHHLTDLTLLIFHRDGVLDPSPFLRSAPNLQRLSLFSDDGASLFESSLWWHYPSLTSLYLCDEPSVIINAPDISWEVEQARGVREIVLHGYYVVLDTLSQQIVRKSNEHLAILDIVDIDLHEETLECLSTFIFPFLTRLTFDCVNRFYHPECQLAFLARSVPNLRPLTLKVVGEPYGNSNVPLPQITTLNTSHLEHADITINDYFTSDQLLKFFDLMTGESLRTIILQDFTARTLQALSTIATKCPALDKLVIKYYNHTSIRILSEVFDHWSSVRPMNQLCITVFPKSIHFLGPQRTYTQDDIMELLGTMNKAAK